MKLFISLCLLLLTRCNGAVAQEFVLGNLMIVPLPAAMHVDGDSLVLQQGTAISMTSFPTMSFDPIAVFSDVFQRKSGYALLNQEEIQKKSRATTAISITYVEDADNGKAEGYSLDITSSGISILASNEQGVFYALQTLRQIMRMDALPDANGLTRAWKIPAVRITDFPQFSYRGMHLDVCRHFMPLDFVKKYIDLLAYYKMNRFHWHLTEDQGWRIEIKRFPKLQEVAAWRDETLMGHYRETPDRYDGIRHGGFYTHEEIKEVVAYAAQRGVTIIPEIEMPGHALAALTAYPKLGCTAGPYEVATTWGVFDDVFCTKESTFTFLQGVLDEVLTLFPSPYIHIGGDECPKTRWKSCEHCQARIQQEGLKDEHQLQSYFIKRIEKYLNSKGRNIIGWDEILEGGLAPNATVMSWRGMKGGIEAAKAGHDVIMTPGTHCYFDHYQADPATEPIAFGGLTTLEKVYSFKPVPDVLSIEEAKHILGAQANLWTEYISSTNQAEYMAYPRALALAEVLWTPSSMRSWPEFTARLNQHLERLDGMNVNYARHLNDPSVQTFSNENGLGLIWKTSLSNQPIYFTRDTSVGVWQKAAAGDTSYIVNGGPVFYKSDISKIQTLDYRPTKASVARITSNPAPDASYPGADGIKTLTDGLIGTIHFNGKEWCAWRTGFSIDLDFPQMTRVDSVSINVLSSPGSWIHFPVSLEVNGSTDHQNYERIGHWESGPLAPGKHTIRLAMPGTEVKHLRIYVLPLISIPEGRPGAGKGAWTFIDEISVY